MSKTPVKAARPGAKKAVANAPAKKAAPRPAAKAPVAKKAAPKPGAKAAGKPIAGKSTAKPAAKPAASKKPTVKATANRPVATKKPAPKAAPVKTAKTPAAAPAKQPAPKPMPAKPAAPVAQAPKISVPAKTVTATTKPEQPAAAPKAAKRSSRAVPPPVADSHPPSVPLPPPGRPAASNVIDLPRPVRKIDPKLANVWKTKAGRDLTDDELLSMPDSEYMNEKQLEFFKARLMQQRNDLLDNAGETTEHLREDTSIVPDPADRATIEEEHALELRTRDRERKLLKKISQSIARIEAGDYGYCDETGEPIGLGRLLARPTATLSLEAQQRREMKQKMFGD